MMEAAKGTALDIKYMLPSCVPATPFEHAGAEINAPEMEEPIQREGILGLGEFMNFPGVIQADESVLDLSLIHIQTVLTTEEGQIVFVDTPGIHKAKNKLGEYMVNVAERRCV